MTCPLCQSDRATGSRSYRSPFVGLAYTLYECAGCGSAFFDEAEHAIDLEQVYERYHEGSVHDYSADVPDSYYWRAQVRNLQQLGGDGVRSVLDVGCRTGDFLMHWPGEIHRVGVELSKPAADVAEARGLEVVRGFVEQAQFESRFDVVSCYAVVEHLRQPLPFLESLPRLLRPGGVLVIMIPTRECLKRRVVDLAGLQWHMYSPPQHLNFASRRRLDELLAGHGIDLVSRRYTSGGTFNPLRRIPRVGGWIDRLMLRVDHVTPFNRVPVFDHMYSFYRAAA